jgi:HNH endonuclease
MADFEAGVRKFIRERADGICEYCRISERFTLAVHEVDHIIAVKHGGRTTDENLALCCTLCNRYEGSDIASIDAETGRLTPLFHPRLDRWADHFEFRNGEIMGLTAAGRATIRLLRMNRPARVRERQLI